ncbi:hypothetical protein PIB30_081326 [Stylosanthes scabra]|uniref:Uncharacterized protein n=1 Tax=Stylosanthes scabra TaxID=79078 RepID=A0ABU6QRA9_9FABA|nr:hypothetical protein [Stylosanthes scabra]
MSSHPFITTMMDSHKTANINHRPKGGVIINKGVGIPTNNLNTANPTTTIHHKIPKTQDTNLHIVDNPTHSTKNSQLSYKEAFPLSQQENKEMREVAKRTEAQISHLTDLMTKFATQMLPSTSTPPPPPNPSPLLSQPLPNPKGGINVVEKGDEKKEKKDARTEWLIELIAKANAMVESDDEEEQVKEASKEEVEVVEEYGKLCLATVFEGEKAHKPILPVKCKDPGPCLVTCEDIFTTADMGIVSIAGITEDVVGKIGSLTVPADFHVIRSTRHSKVGNVDEVYHPRKPSATSKKSAHQIQLKKEDKDERKRRPCKEEGENQEAGEDNSKEKKEEEEEKRRLELKCKSVEDLIGKLYVFKEVLHHSDAMTRHLVKDQSKWK